MTTMAEATAAVAPFQIGDKVTYRDGGERLTVTNLWQDDFGMPPKRQWVAALSGSAQDLTMRVAHLTKVPALR